MNILIIIFVAVFSQLYVKAGAGKDAGIQPHALLFLGDVEGKAYFYEKTKRNWTSSGDYCNALGLQLGTIETASQEAFLISKYTYGGFYDYYWMGARDAHVSRQFSWNSTGTAATNFTVVWGAGSLEYQTCAMYGSWAPVQIAIRPCREYAMALCQTYT